MADLALCKDRAYVETEISLLRSKHQQSLQAKLKRRQFMTTIVLRWKNIKLSNCFE